MIDLAYLSRFSVREQLQSVAAELHRAAHWQQDREKSGYALEQAEELLRIMLQDARWKERSSWLELLLEEIAKVRVGVQSAEKLLAAL